MPAKLTTAERAEFAEIAVEMSSRGVDNIRIAEGLGVHRHTVKRLIDNELASRAEHRNNDRERSIAIKAAVIREAWKRLERTDDRSLNASGQLNVILRASESIDRLTGAEAARKVEGDIVVRVVYDD